MISGIATAWVDNHKVIVINSQFISWRFLNTANVSIEWNENVLRVWKNVWSALMYYVFIHLSVNMKEET
jgi:hypothetical protein